MTSQATIATVAIINSSEEIVEAMDRMERFVASCRAA